MPIKKQKPYPNNQSIEVFFNMVSRQTKKQFQQRQKWNCFRNEGCE